MAQAAVERRLQRDLRGDRRHRRRGAGHPGVGGAGAPGDVGGRGRRRAARRDPHRGRRRRDGGAQPGVAPLPPVHRPGPGRGQAAGARRPVRVPRAGGRIPWGSHPRQRGPRRAPGAPGGPVAAG